jgi:hypothetical protein
MNSFHFRCSSLHALMADPKAIDPALLSTPELAARAAKKVKTDEDRAILAPLFDLTLSAGARSYLEDLAQEYVYGYTNIVSSKHTQKGIIVEDRSIELYNERFFTSYRKNKERRTNDYITGECDIYTGEKIIDIKSSWSLATFPSLSAQAHKTEYEWQMRGYMWLWDVDEAEVAYCLVDTPEELIGYEDRHLHIFDRPTEYREDPLPIELRITTITYLRDRAIEERIMRRVTAARAYLDAIVARIHTEHGLPH